MVALIFNYFLGQEVNNLGWYEYLNYSINLFLGGDVARKVTFKKRGARKVFFPQSTKEVGRHLNKALFLDRDGVINVEENYIYKIADFKFKDGIFEVLKHFQSLNYLLVVITNQSGIGRGYYNEADFWALTDWMIKQFSSQGIKIAKVYFSPYHPEHGRGKYKKDSDCRKPKPGMIFQAQQDLDLDLAASILVGDQETDIEAGINAGIKKNILVSELPLTKPTKATMVVSSLKDLLGIQP